MPLGLDMLNRLREQHSGGFNQGAPSGGLQMQPLQAVRDKRGNIDADATSTRITQRGSQLFDQVHRPALENVISSVDDTSVISGALGREGQGVERARGLRQRQMGRFGVRPTALQQQELDISGAATDALGRSTEVNQAREQQRERNTNLRIDLANVGRGIESNSAAGLRQAADSQVNRQNANRANKAAHTSGMIQSGGAILAAAFL